MADKIEAEPNRDTLQKQLRLLNVRLKATEDEYGQLQKHFWKLLDEGAILLRFAARVGLSLRHLEPELAALNIAEDYIVLLRKLNEIGKLSELQKTENDMEEEVLEIVRQQPVERTGLSPLAFVTGIKYGIDIFGG